MFKQSILKKTMVRQQDQTDCGVACLLSLIKLYNGDSTLEKLRELSGTSRHGTTLLGLYQAANQLGFKAEGCQADTDALIKHEAPVILHVVLNEQLQHYVVCYGYFDNQFVIGDPASGIKYLSLEELEDIWKSRSCLVLEPSANFVKARTNRSNQRKWFLEILQKDYRLLAISAVLGLGMAVLGMAMAIFSQKLVDDILPSGEAKKLITGIILLTFLLIIRILFNALREFLLIRQSKDFNNRIIDTFYDSLLNLPKPFFDTRKIGELVARLNDTNRIQKVIKQLTSNFVVDVLMAVVSIVFLFGYSWQVGIIALVSIPIYFLIIYSYNSRIIRSQREVMEGYAASESNYITSIQGIATIKNNNRQTIFRNVNKTVYGNYQQRVFQLGKINVSLGLLAGMSGIVFLISILSYTSHQVFYEVMTIGELLAVLSISGSLLPSITNLALVSIPINEARIAFNRMFEFAALKKEAPGKLKLTEINSLSLKNVTFRFAGRSQLLKDISIHIAKNELIAITGESGSGKSTLGQILQKFYAFESGSICINGNLPLEDINTADWRSNIGVIPQEVVLFPGNVIDNILLGEKDDPMKVVAFCEEHGFHHFINNFPGGYGAVLGESGINLSGGQKQIIALARALYKKPQLLILDEATSAMDRKTEKFAMELLEKLKQEMAVFFISHRLHTLKQLADRIYVLEEGVIKASGNHEQLMKTTNFYSDFWHEIDPQKVLQL
jgi:ABC-type bacteriocin/lantibiotic exporter with double-glycine peptidase domain